MKRWPLRSLTSVNPLHFFLVVAAVFGVVFLLVTPPFEGADELVHFYRAYQVSDGHIMTVKTSQGKVGGELPASVAAIVDDTASSLIMFHPQVKYKEGLTRTALSERTTKQQRFYEFGATAPYAPTTYTGEIVGIDTARILRLPMMVIFYAARLGNLLNWLVLMGAAIYFLPKRKWLMVSVGLIPMALFQASTINGDAMTVGSVALFLALILRFREYERLLRKREIVLLIVIGTIMLLSKEIMFIFLPLLLLLKKRNIGSGRGALLTNILLWGVPLLCFMGWMYIIRGVGSTVVYANGQNPTEQLKFIVLNPHSYINVLWNTYFYTWGDSITRSFIGTFGWADAPLSELLVVIGYTGLTTIFVASVAGEENQWLDKKTKLLLTASIVLYWLTVSTALYIAYTPLHFKIVYGLQGRYFLPLALLAIPLLTTKRIRFDKDLYSSIVVCLPLFLLSCSVFTVFVRYFVNNV